MNYRMFFSVVIVCALSYLRSFAFVYEVKIMRKWDAEHNRYHAFIGISDFHDKTHAINGVQLTKIKELLGKCDKNDVKIAVEDLSSPNNSGRFACGRFFVNSRGGILGGLADESRALKIDVLNPEHRYCRVVTLGPVLNNLKEPLDKFPSATMTPMAALVQEIGDVVNEIRTYEDGFVLKKIYEDSIKDVIKQLQALHLDKHINVSVAAYLHAHSQEHNRLDLLKRLLTFDSGLLDLKLVHSVISSKNKAKYVAIAGGAHINRTCELLAKVGYEPVQTTKVTYMKEHDLQRCLGSNIIEGAFCVKPQPISIDFLQELILSK